MKLPVECPYKDGEFCAIGGITGNDYECGYYNCPIKEEYDFDKQE